MLRCPRVQSPVMPSVSVHFDYGTDGRLTVSGVANYPILEAMVAAEGAGMLRFAMPQLLERVRAAKRLVPGESMEGVMMNAISIDFVGQSAVIEHEYQRETKGHVPVE